jgi:hypothetical protein
MRSRDTGVLWPPCTTAHDGHVLPHLPRGTEEAVRHSRTTQSYGSCTSRTAATCCCRHRHRLLPPPAAAAARPTPVPLSPAVGPSPCPPSCPFRACTSASSGEGFRRSGAGRPGPAAPRDCNRAPRTMSALEHSNSLSSLSRPFRSCSEFGIPIYITETGIADARDDRRAIMIDTYMKEVRDRGCTTIRPFMTKPT